MKSRVGIEIRNVFWGGLGRLACWEGGGIHRAFLLGGDFMGKLDVHLRIKSGVPANKGTR